MTDYSQFDTTVRVRWGRVALVYLILIGGIVGITAFMGGCTPAEAGELMTRAELDAHMEPYFNQVVDAIYLAEGGAKTRHPFGILSVKCNGYADCREVCYRTVRNNYHRWIDSGRIGGYLEFLAKRYCPTKGSMLTYHERKLNVNWIKNVRYFIEREPNMLNR